VDIYCTNCGEPCAIDHLHDVAEEDGTTFDRVRADFYRRGCVAVGFGRCEARDTLRGAAMAALADMLGDDIDGIASMLEDADF